MADSWLDVSRKSTEGNATFAESTAFNRTSGSSFQAELFLTSALAGGESSSLRSDKPEGIATNTPRRNVSFGAKGNFRPSNYKAM